ncbi:phage tail tape measure protein [Phaeobacter sp. JH204B]|uniref:phage tail tape measure protein n=1 Tax=Phaeobacter sp. JH204B TaxID=3112503 RepID=UPI003A8391DB
MATGDLNIALILKLVDQVSAPARQATAALDKIGHVTEQTGRRGVEWANQQLEANKARRSALQGEVLGLAALGGTLLGLTEPAIQAERRLAEVSKVVSFKDANGLTILQTQIRELVTSGGLAATAEGMTDIIAAAGRMGVVDENLPDDEKRRQLLEFATDAAKMSAAFGITADEAGTALARWRQNLNLTHTEAMVLGDTVNLLGNTMATSEADILAVINRQGTVAKSAGLAADEIAALSATLLAAGAAPEVAATGLKNFTNALTRGSNVTKRQKAVYKALGLDPVQLAKDMQDDATGAILKVTKSFDSIPVHQRNSMVGILFGEEAKGAITPLITNVEMLETALAKAADTASLLGLMEEEYSRQAATTFVQRQRLLEFAKAMAVVVGTAVLPQMNELMAALMPIVAAMTDWAAAHPALINGVMKAALALFSLRVASIALRWSLFSILPVFLHIIRAGSGLLMLAPLLARGLLALLNPLKLVRGALIAIRWAFLATGIGALLAGVAMAGIWIYNNWSGLGAFFTGFWDGFRAALGPAAPMLDEIIQAARDLWQWFANLLGPLDASRDAWTSWGTGAGAALGQMVASLFEWDGSLGRVIASAAALYAGFAALRLIWWLPMAPIFAAGKLLMWVGKGPLLLLLRGVKLLSGAFVRLGALAMANPIGLVIAAVAALAYVVYDNWDKIVGTVTEKIELVRAAFDEGLIKGVFKLLAEFNPFTLAIEGAIGLVAYVMELLGVPQQIIAKFREISLFASGVTLMKSLWDGMASIVDQAVTFITNKLANLKPQWLTDLQAWASGDSPTAKAATGDGRERSPRAHPLSGQRDAGGPVRAGMPYLVGERSAEIFVPGVSGSILPTRVLKAAMAATSLSIPAAAVAGPGEIQRQIDPRPALSAQAAAPQITRQGDTINITIAPPQGTDEAAIARMVMQELNRRESARRADLHDGLDY